MRKIENAINTPRALYQRNMFRRFLAFLLDFLIFRVTIALLTFPLAYTSLSNGEFGLFRYSICIPITDGEALHQIKSAFQRHPEGRFKELFACRIRYWPQAPIYVYAAKSVEINSSDASDTSTTRTIIIPINSDGTIIKGGSFNTLRDYAIETILTFLFIAYSAIFSFKFKQTIGKEIMRILIVSDRETNLSAGKLFEREILKSLPVLIYMVLANIVAITLLFSNKTTTEDMAAYLIDANFLIPTRLIFPTLIAGCGFLLLLLYWFVFSFRRSTGQLLYERLSGTRVERVPKKPKVAEEQPAES